MSWKAIKFAKLLLGFVQKDNGLNWVNKSGRKIVWRDCNSTLGRTVCSPFRLSLSSNSGASYWTFYTSRLNGYSSQN